jgi:putative membrane protein
MLSYLVLALKGIVYGVTHIAPGIGGGIVLIMMNIYEPFVEAVGNILNWRKWKEHMPFLIAIGVGAVIGMIGLAKLMNTLLEHYPVITMFFFMGLLLGTIPSILRQHGDMRLSSKRGLAFALGLVLVVVIKTIEKQGVQAGFAADLHSAGGMAYNLFTSFAAGGASITPGMDGSYIFLLVGTYKAITEALGRLTSLYVDWGIIIPTGIGSAAGIILFAKLIDLAIKRRPAAVYYVVLGIVAGSVYGLWPAGWRAASIPLSILFLALGAAIAWFFGRKSEEEVLESAAQVATSSANSPGKIKDAR